MRPFAAIGLAFALSVPAWAAEPPVFTPPEPVFDLGAGAFSPRDFRRIGDVAVFRAGSDLVDLWRTDGTAAGTWQILADARLDSFFGPDDGTKVYFLRWRDAWELWRTDGTTAGTIALTPGMDFSSRLGLYDVRSPTWKVVPETGLLFFSAGLFDASPRDYELWVTDGTPVGTRLVMDVNPQRSSLPNSMETLGGKLFFVAQTPEGTEVWRSDGTAAGTVKLKDLQPGDDRAILIRRIGDALVVLSYTDTSTQVWRSDGTAAGTVLVKDVPGGALTFRAAGRHLFFGVTRGTGSPTELWGTDGTAAGTQRLLQGIDEEANSEWSSLLFAAGDSLLFSLWDPEHGYEPWASDGTPAGTGLVADICPGPCSSGASFGHLYRSRVLVNAADAVSGSEPWLVEARKGGNAYRLGDLCPGPCDSSAIFQGIAGMAGGWAVFAATGPDGRELWVSDGSPDAAVRVSDFPAEEWLPPFGLSSTGLGNRLVFTYQPTGEPPSLWSLALPPLAVPPDPPPGDWITSPALPGFRVKGRITAGTEVRSVRSEPCLGETVCLSGAVPGRPELFVRVIGPRPNGYLWPTLVRFTTSQAEVWIEQPATGAIRYYLLEAVPRDSDELSGLVDRTGFLP